MSNAVAPIDTVSAGALAELGVSLRRHGYQFTTVTPATHARINGRHAGQLAVDLAGVFGWSRPFRRDTISPEIIRLMEAAGVLLHDSDGWRSRVRASTLNGDIFFHSAYPTTAADAVFFGPDTYRFVSAIDQHLATRAAGVRHAVDLCCGAAPGAVAIARHYPQAHVIAADINDAALRLARINSLLAACSQIDVRHSNLLTHLDGSFDLIVANPPYMVDSSKRAYRDGGGALGAGLSLAIVDAALPRLNPEGTLLLYTGAAIVNGTDPFYLAARHRLLGKAYQWGYREIDPDVFGEELMSEPYAAVDRIAAVFLAVSRCRS